MEVVRQYLTVEIPDNESGEMRELYRRDIQDIKEEYGESPDLMAIIPTNPKREVFALTEKDGVPERKIVLNLSEQIFG